MSKTNPQEPKMNGVAGQLISASQFAKMLDISKRTLHRLQSKGVLPPPIRIGGSIRWRLDVVNRWIENGCPC